LPPQRETCGTLISKSTRLLPESPVASRIFSAISHSTKPDAARSLAASVTKTSLNRFLIGAKRDLVSPISGRLSVGINQTSSDTGDGTYSVRIEIYPVDAHSCPLHSESRALHERRRQ